MENTAQPTVPPAAQPTPPVQAPPAPPPPQKKSSKILLGIVGGLVLLFAIGGFAWGYLFANQKSYETSATPTTPAPTIQEIGSVCKKYGVLDPSEFLTSYTVQKGDTPNAIVEKEFQSRARVNEFLTLNKRYDPSFSASPEAELTPGSKVYLIPKEIAKSTGNLYGKGGQYMRTEDKYYWIKTRTEPEKTGDTPLYLTVNTKILDEILYEDCIISINDTNSTPVSHEALIIKKAEKVQK